MRKLILLSLILFCSCNKQAKETTQTDNTAFQVDFLFEHNGFKVYRFYDAGHNHYFVEPKGEVLSTQTNGKQTHPENIQTK